MWLAVLDAISAGVPTATTSPARLAALGTHVDDPVGTLDHIQVVLDHDHGVALVDQPVQHFQQSPNIFKMETGRRFVQEINRFFQIRRVPIRWPA